jgi:hypothetical protein
LTVLRRAHRSARNRFRCVEARVQRTCGLSPPVSSAATALVHADTRRRTTPRNQLLLRPVPLRLRASPERLERRVGEGRLSARRLRPRVAVTLDSIRAPHRGGRLANWALWTAIWDGVDGVVPGELSPPVATTTADLDRGAPERPRLVLASGLSDAATADGADSRAGMPTTTQRHHLGKNVRTVSGWSLYGDHPSRLLWEPYKIVYTTLCGSSLIKQVNAGPRTGQGQGEVGRVPFARAGRTAPRRLQLHGCVRFYQPQR